MTSKRKAIKLARRGTHYMALSKDATATPRRFLASASEIAFQVERIREIARIAKMHRKDARVAPVYIDTAEIFG